MKDWFTSFEACLDGGTAPADLIGAGTATSDRAMAHYRFQHQAKYREAVEDTFPVLIRSLGDNWNSYWDDFWATHETSPRSLDWVSGTFIAYFGKTSAELWVKELARFEHLLEIHPWSHRKLLLKDGPSLSENSRVILGKYELISFQAPVTMLYAEEACEKSEKETVLIWQKGDSTYFRPMQDWEISVLKKLPEGVEAALEDAPEDEEAVGEFFQWLGSSHLIQDIRQD